MADIGPPCLTPAMKEQRFHHRPPAAATPPPLPDLNQTEIPIKWNGGAAAAVKIRHQPNGSRTKTSIYFRPMGRSGLDGLHALFAAQAQMIFDPEPGRRAA